MILLAFLFAAKGDVPPLVEPPKKDRVEWKVGAKPNEEPTSAPIVLELPDAVPKRQRHWLFLLKAGAAIELATPLAGGIRGAFELAYRFEGEKVRFGLGLEASVAGVFSSTRLLDASRVATLGLTPLLSIETMAGPGHLRFALGPRFQLAWLHHDTGSWNTQALGGHASVAYTGRIGTSRIGAEVAYWFAPYRATESELRMGHSLGLSFVYGWTL